MDYLFIGMILIVNAAWLRGKADAYDAGIFNLFVGVLATGTALYFGLVEHNYPLAAGGVLFGVTYLWTGWNAVRGATDQRALGIYCALVAFVTVPYAIKALLGGDLGWAFEWISYGTLWYLFYQLHAVKPPWILKPTIAMTYFVGIEVAITGWLYLYGYWPFGNWWPVVHK
ncbi:hypothetical protein MSM1_17070 [Mycobacterium sp. SM1]|uniref:AmiS/UreI family transporter n=1 Tax=Mycobacterium sp. SM1 TaxID=2816243 RepID=UPI001BCDA638|nr:AmiS/UreI family transporter [Mycobacterium sp. SM1]MBS4729979.1 hypothetical protein [Mycobacterium sp. SM1]